MKRKEWYFIKLGPRWVKTLFTVDHNIPIRQHSHLRRYHPTPWGTPTWHFYPMSNFTETHPWYQEALQTQREQIEDQVSMLQRKSN